MFNPEYVSGQYISKLWKSTYVYKYHKHTILSITDISTQRVNKNSEQVYDLRVKRKYKIVKRL